MMKMGGGAGADLRLMRAHGYTRKAQAHGRVVSLLVPRISLRIPSVELSPARW